MDRIQSSAEFLSLGTSGIWGLILFCFVCVWLGMGGGLSHSKLLVASLVSTHQTPVIPSPPPQKYVCRHCQMPPRTSGIKSLLLEKQRSNS